MLMATTSPSFRKMKGYRVKPTPSGVPVRITASGVLLSKTPYSAPSSSDRKRISFICSPKKILTWMITHIPCVCQKIIEEKMQLLRFKVQGFTVKGYALMAKIKVEIKIMLDIDRVLSEEKVTSLERAGRLRKQEKGVYVS
jgi:hypothetical protein